MSAKGAIDRLGGPFFHALTNTRLSVAINNITRTGEQLAACTNGGHEAYLCPHGCHLLPFSLEVEA